MNRRSILASLLALLLVWLPCMAQTNISVTTWLNTPGLYGGQAAGSFEGSPFTVLAGQFRADSGSDQWITYCTDFQAHLASGPFMNYSLSQAQAMPDWQTPDWSSTGLTLAAQLFRTFGSEVSSSQQAVALQTMIWDALYDGAVNPNSGRFQLSPSGTTSGVLGQIMSWNNTPLQPVADVSWWGPSTSGGSYRVAQGLFGNTAYAVPEAPTATVLVAAAPLILLTYGLRKLKQS